MRDTLADIFEVLAVIALIIIVILLFIPLYIISRIVMLWEWVDEKRLEVQS